jgi:tetratricopeptide (TPR) repeat protein
MICGEHQAAGGGFGHGKPVRAAAAWCRIRASNTEAPLMDPRDRIATFKIHIAQTPDDPFPRYALAMEYHSQGILDKAKLAFRDLVNQFPDYVPTYLMYGSILNELGDRDAAIDIYTKGIEVAGRKRDAHAKNELQDALENLRRNP